MKEFLKGCLVGLIIIAGVATFIGFFHILRVVGPWISFTLFGAIAVLGMGFTYWYTSK